MRGYREGQASPNNIRGDSVGSETYVLFNAELTQKLVGKFSASFFLDSVGFARRIKNYPFNKVLYSLGGGLSYATPIGPIRLEYAHNLNPRRRDPKGQIVIAIGFPF